MVGNGDFFGPLIVAGVLYDAATVDPHLPPPPRRWTRQATFAGVNALKPFVGRPALIEVSPKRYNELLKAMGSRQKVIAWTMAASIKRLPEAGYRTVAVASDFGDRAAVYGMLRKERPRVELMEARGQPEDEAVRAASFFSHVALLAARKQMVKKWHMRFPAGARAVEPVARRFVDRYGAQALLEVAKADFSTFDRVVGTEG